MNSEIETQVRVEGLEEGDLCEFAYYQQAGNYQWYEWHSMGVFLGVSRDGNDVLVSYRPLAGTSSIPIRDIRQIDRHLPAKDRRSVRGDGRARLPQKLRGAVKR